MRHRQYAFLAFAMYFLTGVICMMIGSIMTSLLELYDRPLDQIVLIGSAFALGRLSSVMFIGRMVEKHDPLKVLFIGVCCIMTYLVGVVALPVYYLAFVLAFLGGIGMSTQDAVCPLLLSKAYPQTYSSALSIGQAIYGMGGFAISALVGLLLIMGVPFQLANYLLALVGLVMLAVIPNTRWEDQKTRADEEKVRPLYARNRKLCLAILMFACFVYCAICIAIGSYLTSYMEALGASRQLSSYVLAFYNLSAVFGSMVFTLILARVREKSVLVFNSFGCLLVLSAAMYFNSVPAFEIAMSLIGFFIGVIFSLFIAIATRLDHEHIAAASALIAVSGSIGDIVSPLISSRFLVRYGLSHIFIYIAVLLALMCMAAVLIAQLPKEEGFDGNSK